MGFASYLAGRKNESIARRRPTAAGRAAVARAAFGAVEPLEGRVLFATYTITDLGTLGGPSSTAAAINQSGQVAVTADLPIPGGDTIGPKHAARATGGSLTDIGTHAGGSDSEAVGINASGNVAGNNTTNTAKAFLWNGTDKTDLGTLGGSYAVATAINDNNVVVGSSQKPDTTFPNDGIEHAFIWQGGTMTDLGALGDLTLNRSVARAINNSGVAAGESSLDNSETHAVRWTGSTIVDLGVLAGGIGSAAYGINDGGSVVGRSYIAAANDLDNAPYRAFLHNGSSMTGLGVLSGDTYSSANDINNNGVVVGYSDDDDDATAGARAFVVDGGPITDLNTLIDAGAGWTLNEATGVNDAGQIVGVGTINGQRHAFLLTPSGGVGDQTPPAATITQPSVAQNDTTLTVSVTYTDDAAVLASSIDINDIQVVRSGQPALTVQSVTLNPTTDAASITATYVLAAPGGSWEASDDGNYAVSLKSGQVRDAGGNFAPATSINLAVNFSATSGPGVTIAPVGSVTAAGGTTGTVTVTYTDPNNVSVATIAPANITIFGGAQTLNVTGVTTNPTTDATSVQAVYTFDAPGGTWDSSDNDTYSISVNAGSVTDALGNPVTSAGATFAVDIPVVIPTLDPAFNGGNPVDSGFVAEASVADLDGKLYVVGHSGDLAAGTSSGVIKRYNPDGSLDDKFGSGGTVTTPAGQNDAFYNIALDPAGKLFVVSGARGNDFLAARYAVKNGKLDGKFGNTKGAFVLDQGATTQEAFYGLAVGADSSVYLSGGLDNGILFLKLDKKGRLDEDFGFNGSTVVSTATASTGAKLVLQADGSLIAAGDIEGSVFVTKLASDGSLDPGFNGGIAVILSQLSTRTDLGGPDRTIGLAVQPDGKVLVANRTSGGEFGVARLDAAGAADGSFSGDGFLNIDLGGSVDDADAVLVQGTGEIVLVGTGNAGGTVQTAVAVVDAAGNPVADFDDDGEFLAANGVTNGAAPFYAAATIQPNGDLAVLTSSGAVGSTSSVRRLNLPGSGNLGQFGVVNGRRKSLVFTDSDGTKTTLSLKVGTVNAFYNGENLDFVVTGSTIKGSIGIKGKGGDGRTRVGDVRVDGALGAFSGKTTDVFGTVFVNGELKKLEVGTLSGTIAANGNIGSATFRGDLAGANVLAGANLGADAELGGGDDAFGAAVLSKISVSGAVAASVVGAGFDPIDGNLLNGGAVVGGPASEIKSVSVKQVVDGVSRFFAGAFGKIKAPGKVDVATDPRFEVL